MHSGIGEEKQLQQFNIPVIENLKGVGKEFARSSRSTCYLQSKTWL